MHVFATTQRMISPATLESVRYWRWLLKFYTLRRLAGIVVKRPPIVLAAGAGAETLVQRLNRINTFAPTHSCRIMTRYGSDKGRSWHNYTTVYDALFRDCRPLRIFELGLGTNNPELPSTMGANGKPGASLRGWKRLFPAARIFGADIDHATLFREDRINTFWCDQLDSSAIRDVWSKPELRGGIDVIVEDGLHTFEANQTFLEISLHFVTRGGWYIVEDIRDVDLDHWRNWLDHDSQRFPSYQFVLIRLPNAFNHFDNNLLVAHRAS